MISKKVQLTGTICANRVVSMKKSWAAAVLPGILCLLLCVACNIVETKEKYLGAWISIKEISTGDADIQVSLENNVGNIPNGARVFITSPESSVTQLSYNSQKAVYTETISDLTSGTYTITVDSILKTVVKEIEYYPLSKELLIDSIMDSEGTEAGSGQNLNSEKAITIDWNSIEYATVYKGTIKMEGETAAVFSSNDNYYTLSAEKIEAGKTYSVEIEAQYIAGDPYLQEETYYVYSFTKSPEYYFTTQ